MPAPSHRYAPTAPAIARQIRHCDRIVRRERLDRSASAISAYPVAVGGWWFASSHWPSTHLPADDHLDGRSVDTKQLREAALMITRPSLPGSRCPLVARSIDHYDSAVAAIKVPRGSIHSTQASVMANGSRGQPAPYHIASRHTGRRDESFRAGANRQAQVKPAIGSIFARRRIASASREFVHSSILSAERAPIRAARWRRRLTSSLRARVGAAGSSAARRSQRFLS